MRIHDLYEDSLGEIFRHLSPKERVSLVSLVCKNWQRVEREHPYLVRLCLEAKDFDPSYIAWCLRDTSQLREVLILAEVCGHFDASNKKYREWVPKLLRHLAVSAPALISLDLKLPIDPWLNFVEPISTLPLIGELRQLETLTLRKWVYHETDCDQITHLTRLHNLKVIFWIWRPMSQPPFRCVTSPGQRGGQHFQAKRRSNPSMSLKRRDLFVAMEAGSLLHLPGMQHPALLCMLGPCFYSESALQAVTLLIAFFYASGADNNTIKKAKEGAAQHFQETLLGLQLTGLELSHADFMESGCPAILPSGDVGSLVGLRSLTYKSHCSRSCCPCLDKLQELTRLHLDTRDYEEAESIMLTSLCKLRDLSIIKTDHQLEPLTLSRSAEVTRLWVEGDVASGMRVHNVLPLDMLQSVKDLTLTLKFIGQQPIWPEAWDQLTSITRLELDFRHGSIPEDEHGFSLAPVVLPAFKVVSLMDVEVTAASRDFGEKDLLDIIGCLPVLSRLKINLVGTKKMDLWGTWIFDDSSEQKQRLENICIAVQARTPGLEFSLRCCDGASSHFDLQLVLMINLQV